MCGLLSQCLVIQEITTTSSVYVDWGMFPPLLPEVNNQLLCFAEFEGEVVVLAPQCLVVVSSTNLMMELVSCKATQ